ncbi:DUF3796 domain-containing protein [Mammaliicoccus sciuri]|uniref:DUF3796 domain-containing protein n=1 Tax=Sporosarcina TaxID=1569 RepID=UPI001C8E8670|nr:DUF3796 domain-containing protein [Sporosarcina aquimarina]MBY0222800.1 DUF3796 domain-containing protein [Sporosarcina aquimarina]
MLPSSSGLLGFLMGFGTVLAIAVYLRRKGKKQRLFDERYEKVHAKARTISWGITIIVLAAMWLGALLYEGIQLAFILLSVAYGIMLISYGIASLVIDKRE